MRKNIFFHEYLYIFTEISSFVMMMNYAFIYLAASIHSFHIRFTVGLNFQGIFVTRVQPEGPASKILQPGDKIILVCPLFSW